MTDTLSNLVHTVRPKTPPRTILRLGTALSVTLTPGQDLPKPSIIPNLPGALYTAADPAAISELLRCRAFVDEAKLKRASISWTVRFKHVVFCCFPFYFCANHRELWNGPLICGRTGCRVLV